MSFWIKLLSLRKLLTGLHVIANGTSLLVTEWTPSDVRGLWLLPVVLGMSLVYCQGPGKRSLRALIQADLFNPFHSFGNLGIDWHRT